MAVRMYVFDCWRGDGWAAQSLTVATDGRTSLRGRPIERSEAAAALAHWRAEVRRGRNVALTSYTESREVTRGECDQSQERYF